MKSGEGARCCVKIIFPFVFQEEKAEHTRAKRQGQERCNRDTRHTREAHTHKQVTRFESSKTRNGVARLTLRGLTIGLLPIVARMQKRCDETCWRHEKGRGANEERGEDEKKNRDNRNKRAISEICNSRPNVYITGCGHTRLHHRYDHRGVRNVCRFFPPMCG